MNKHFKSIKRCCKQFSSYCCYLLLHLLDFYSDLILFRCISKNPLIEAKWKTLNAHCFVCVVEIIQKIHIVQIPQASKLTLLQSSPEALWNRVFLPMAKMIFWLFMKSKTIHTASGLEQHTDAPSLELIPFSCLFTYLFHRWNLNHTERASARSDPRHSTAHQHTSLLLTLALFLSDGRLPSLKQL